MLEQCLPFACVLLARVLDPFAQRGLCCFKRRVENVARQGAEGLAVAGDVAIDAIVNRRVEVEDVLASPHHRVRNVRRGFLAGNPPYITNGAALGVLDAEILRAHFDLLADGDLFAIFHGLPPSTRLRYLCHRAKRPAILRRAKSREKRREVICSVESLRHFDPAGCVYSHTAPWQPPVRSIREIMLSSTAYDLAISAKV